MSRALTDSFGLLNPFGAAVTAAPILPLPPPLIVIGRLSAQVALCALVPVPGAARVVQLPAAPTEHSILPGSEALLQ